MVSYFLFLLVQLTQLRAELVSCSEERDELNQSLGQWRNKVDSLERTNCDTRNLISILEDDIRTGRREHKVLKTNIEELSSEKQQVHRKHLNSNIINCLSWVCTIYHLLSLSSEAAGADQDHGTGNI